MVSSSDADIFGAVVEPGVTDPVCSNASPARSQRLLTLASE